MCGPRAVAQLLQALGREVHGLIEVDAVHAGGRQQLLGQLLGAVAWEGEGSVGGKQSMLRCRSARQPRRRESIFTWTQQPQDTGRSSRREAQQAVAQDQQPGSSSASCFSHPAPQTRSQTPRAPSGGCSLQQEGRQAEARDGWYACCICCCCCAAPTPFTNVKLPNPLADSCAALRNLPQALKLSSFLP